MNSSRSRPLRFASGEHWRAVAPTTTSTRFPLATGGSHSADRGSPSRRSGAHAEVGPVRDYSDTVGASGPRVRSQACCLAVITHGSPPSLYGDHVFVRRSPSLHCWSRPAPLRRRRGSSSSRRLTSTKARRSGPTNSLEERAGARPQPAACQVSTTRHLRPTTRRHPPHRELSAGSATTRSPPPAHAKYRGRTWSSMLRRLNR